jgi:hypothetical protein
VSHFDEVHRCIGVKWREDGTSMLGSRRGVVPPNSRFLLQLRSIVGVGFHRYDSGTVTHVGRGVNVGVARTGDVVLRNVIGRSGVGADPAVGESGEVKEPRAIANSGPPINERVIATTSRPRGGVGVATRQSGHECACLRRSRSAP